MRETLEHIGRWPWVPGDKRLRLTNRILTLQRDARHCAAAAWSEMSSRGRCRLETPGGTERDRRGLESWVLKGSANSAGCPFAGRRPRFAAQSYA